MKISFKMRAWARTFFLTNEKRAEVLEAPRHTPPALPTGVAPEAAMALDSNLTQAYAYANSGGFGEGFMGYPALAQLTQLPEYRMLTEKLASAMCRKWVKLTSKGAGDKSEVIKKIEDAMENHKICDLFRKAATLDGFFGRAQLFVDLGDSQKENELQMPLIMDKAKVGKGKLRKFKLIEPMYTYPNDYSATNPLDDSFYNPRSWYVMGRKVHASRLMMFLSRPVPDMLKPSYNFGGLSMSQLAKPYVDNWIRTRTSVSRMISNFSTSGVATDMSTMLLGLDDIDSQEGDDLMARAELFTAMRDNMGLMMMDKDKEEFFQVNTPLTTLDALQAQSQEHMASVSSTPLSVLLGITPTGLNASSDGEIRIFYDHVLAMQKLIFSDNLMKVIQLIQLDLFGQIDPDIIFEFIPLWQQTESELAVNRKSDADAAAVYVGLGAVSAEEVRDKLAKDTASGYTGLKGVIEEPTPDDQGDDKEMKDEKE